MSEKIVVGSRESKLAVIQSEIVMEYLKKQFPAMDVTMITMKTTGDRILDKKLDEIGGKGLFVKELEYALLKKECDICVHSLKDMPMEVSEELPIICFSKREDPRDVLVLPKGASEIDFQKPIGTSSARRMIQLQKIYPEAQFASVRGNVQTRLRKLDEGQYGALILAAAGLKRLGLENRISRYFSVEEVIPAAGQGILAIQGRKDTDRTIFQGFTDGDATAVALAERGFIRALNGGCSAPSAAFSRVENDTVILRGLYVDEKASRMYYGERSGSRTEAEQIGRDLAMELLQQKRG